MDQFPWVQVVSSLGFPIVVVLMIIRGWLVPGFVYERIVEDNDRLSRVVENQVIPLVTESKQVLREALEIAPSIKDFRAALTETQKGFEEGLETHQRILKRALQQIDDNEQVLRRTRSA